MDIHDNFSMNKGMFINLLNRYSYLRYILFSSFFLFYFIYSYINMNIDFKEMYKLFELLFTKNTMLMDHLNSLLGFDLFSIDRSNNTLYCGEEGSQPNSPKSIHNDTTDHIDNQDNVVKLEKLPQKVKLSDYTSITEDEDDSEGIEEDIKLNTEYKDSDDEILDEQRRAKKAKLENSDPKMAEDFDPEFSETSHILSKLKERKNGYRENMKDHVDGYNDTVEDVEKSLKSAKVVEKEKTDYSKINNILNDDSKKTLKRTRDMVDNADEGYTADIEKEAHFPNKESKDDFLSNLSRATKHKNKLDKVSKNYNKVKSQIDGARDRHEEKQKGSKLNDFNDMFDSLPSLKNNKRNNNSKK